MHLAWNKVSLILLRVTTRSGGDVILREFTLWSVPFRALCLLLITVDEFRGGIPIGQQDYQWQKR